MPIVSRTAVLHLKLEIGCLFSWFWRFLCESYSITTSIALQECVRIAILLSNPFLYFIIE